MALAAGTRLGPYEILSALGAGGMGEVYRARDTKLEREVALKFLPALQASDPDARRRLLHEAQAAARLDHPFICKMYDVAQSDEQLFIAMEYVEGTTLEERLAAGPLPLAEAIRLASEIAEALEFAHTRGIIHRDLKPANIMVAADGHAKVMDFGLAKRLPDAGADMTSIATMTVTDTSELAGTLAYMSPEQLRGLPVDARSDVFAFGLVLYEMTTGRHPFRKSSLISTTDAILNEHEPPLDRWFKDAPPLLAHVVSRSLAKDTAQRYQSMHDARIELTRLSGGDHVSSGGLAVRARPRWLWFVSAAAAVVLAAVVLEQFWPASLPFSQRALAFAERDWILISDFENLTGDNVFDRSLHAALEVGVSQSQFVNVFPASRLADTLKRMQKPRVDRLDESLASEVAMREGIRAVLACSIAQVGNVYSLTARLINPQSRVAVLTESVQAKGKDQVLPALDDLATRVRRNLGESLAGISQQRVPLPNATTSSLEALKMYAEGMRRYASDDADELLRQATALDPNFALAHAELGRRYYLKSERADRIQGEEHFVKALSLLERLSARERLWISALAQDSRGNRREAVSAYQSYLARYPDDSRAWFRVGWTQMATLGQIEPAVEAFKHVIAINPSDSGAHINLATCYTNLDRRREAVDEYQKAFALEPKNLTDMFVNHEYGFTLVHLGEVDKAVDVFGRMTAVREYKARGHRSLALLEMYRGRYAAALSHLREAILANHTDGASVSEFRDRLFLVRALQAKGMTREFVSELAAADALAARTSLGPEWLAMLAKIHARSGRVPEARTLLSVMSSRAPDATTGSSANRNSERDRANLDLVRGEIKLAEGKPKEATTLFEAAKLVEPRNSDSLESLAAAAAAGGALEDAVKQYEDLIARRPLGNEGQEPWLLAHVRLGEIYERLGHADLARQSYERLLALWKDGDSDLIAGKEARARLAKLNSAPDHSSEKQK